MPERIGFVSTRFAGTDGVSLESAKWAEVLWDSHHVSFWYAGRLDRSDDMSLCVPEAYFGHAENEWLNRRIWGTERRDRETSRRLHDYADFLKGTLYRFAERFDLSFLIVQNACTIPMHVPLGLAITEFLLETRLPALFHHHDFYWERTRFEVNAVPDLLEAAFPPRIPGQQHACINRAACEELAWRKGLPSTLIPNVLNFDLPPPSPDPYSVDIRAQIGLGPDDIMVLQPTRVVPRKGIEHAIKLVEMLADPRYKLVISHESGDEGMDYHHMLQEMAREANVDLRFIATRIGDVRQLDAAGNKVYTLWDLYPHADLITYPSLYEGFGNAFLEAIYFRKPILLNRYAIYARDIEPLGFRCPLMDGYLRRAVVEEIRRIFEDEAYRQEMVEENFRLARQFFGYPVLRRKLHALIANIKGT